MPAVSELSLPSVDTYDPLLRGPRYHEVMRELREQSWLAISPLGFIALDHESGEFFLRDKRLTFPGMFAAEMFGVTEGPLHEQVRRNILNVNGDDHRRLRGLVNPALNPRAADRVRPGDARLPRASCWSRTPRAGGSRPSRTCASPTRR